MAPAHWTAAEELAFVDFLVANKAEAGDGSNFKAPTFQKAAKDLAHLLQRGGPKTAKSCANKYSAFRKIYRIIRAIQAVSGWTWDDETGASIDVHTASSWDDYVLVHPEARPFRNRGWPLFRKMETLMPATVTGANVYHATTAAPPGVSQLSADPLVDSDEEEATEESQQDADAHSDVEETVRPSSSSKKRQREPATPTKPTAKRTRTNNGANALLSMAESLGTFNTTFAGALAGPSTGVEATPIRRTKAISAVLQLEKGWLTIMERVHLVDFLKADQSAADVYLALTEADVRKEWVRIQLENLGITIFTE